jgi:DNA-binding response OmpR family regulator
MGSRILIVDDEESIRFSLRRALERDEHEVWTAEDGHQALRLVQHHVFDLILTDLKMEGVGGVEVLRQAQAMSPDTAIIMLTGYATLESAIEALRLGVIDYLTKPCSTADIRASVEKGLARRYRELRRRQLLQQMSATLAELRDETFAPTPIQPPAPSPLPSGTRLQTTLRHGNLTIDRQRHQVTVEERKVDLTPTEFKLLAHLTENADKVVSCSELVLAAHGYQTSEDEARKVIRPHITNLRQKLGASLGTQPYILNVRGVGYVLAPAIEESAGNQ